MTTTSGSDAIRREDELNQTREQVRVGYAKIAQTGVWLGNQFEAAPTAPASNSGTKSGPCCIPIAGSGCCEPSGAAAIAKTVPVASPCCTPRAGGGCCGPTTIDAAALARSIGYSVDDLLAAPDSANLGLSCGNPAAIAALRPGEVVLDLGSGAGFDCFIAGPKVGAKGRAIGVDMTPEMLTRARGGLADYTRRTGLANVEFRLGEIEHLPVADASVDVVLSNCVLNLSPDKPQAWKEIARVLRPGGRVAISDLALLKPLPESVRSMVEALVGCVAGASLVSEIERDMKEAGLREIRLMPKSDYIEAMVGADDPLYAKILEELPKGSKVGEFVTSLDIAGVR